ncbi:LysR substrate-binding domain-containing protein [Burkholderia gladioli]|uniref:LysR substrate-binding domain-containing protein n=1 Tax=Burkholderia gladioli TaxID=28095 RepID=UPI003EE3B140
MKELAGIGKGHLNIGASATLGVYLVPGLISSFNAAYPRIGIDLTVSNTERVEAGLRDSGFRSASSKVPSTQACWMRDRSARTRSRLSRPPTIRSPAKRCSPMIWSIRS